PPEAAHRYGALREAQQDRLGRPAGKAGAARAAGAAPARGAQGPRFRAGGPSLRRAHHAAAQGQAAQGAAAAAEARMAGERDAAGALTHLAEGLDLRAGRALSATLTAPPHEALHLPGLSLRAHGTYRRFGEGP